MTSKSRKTPPQTDQQRISTQIAQIEKRIEEVHSDLQTEVEEYRTGLIEAKAEADKLFEKDITQLGGRRVLDVMIAEHQVAFWEVKEEGFRPLWIRIFADLKFNIQVQKEELEQWRNLERLRNEMLGTDEEVLDDGLSQGSEEDG